MQELYGYIFSTGLIGCHFTLYSVLPRQVIMPHRKQLVRDYLNGVIVVEEKDDYPGILELFQTCQTPRIERGYPLIDLFPSIHARIAKVPRILHSQHFLLSISSSARQRCLRLKRRSFHVNLSLNGWRSLAMKLRGNQHFFFCVICDKAIYCEHMGEADVSRHILNALHKKNKLA